MERTVNGGAIHGTGAQRPTAMGTTIIQGVKLAIDIENRHFLAVDDHQLRRSRWICACRSRRTKISHDPTKALVSPVG
jgi:hypothetical protein